jgi:hypothetical protein
MVKMQFEEKKKATKQVIDFVVSVIANCECTLYIWQEESFVTRPKIMIDGVD